MGLKLTRGEGEDVVLSVETADGLEEVARLGIDEIRRTQVRVTIDAPKHVYIDRAEIFERRHAEYQTE